MSRAFPPLAAAGVVLLLTFLPGCGGASTVSTIPLHPELFSSRDGVLRYRLPVGWFDATADSQAVGQVVWLMRNDYAATITVNEVHLDAQARQVLKNGGLLQLSRLLVALAMSDKPGVLQQAPQAGTERGKEFCVYEILTSDAKDSLRVVLFDTGSKVYTVTALVSGEQHHGLSKEVFGVQQSFLSSLRW